MHVLEIFPKNTGQKVVPIEGCKKFGVEHSGTPHSVAWSENSEI